MGGWLLALVFFVSGAMFFSRAGASRTTDGQSAKGGTRAATGRRILGAVMVILGVLVAVYSTLAALTPNN